MLFYKFCLTGMYFWSKFMHFPSFSGRIGAFWFPAFTLKVIRMFGLKKVVLFKKFQCLSFQLLSVPHTTKADSFDEIVLQLWLKKQNSGSILQFFVNIALCAVRQVFGWKITVNGSAFKDVTTQSHYGPQRPRGFSNKFMQ